MKKLRITVEGKVYQVLVETVDSNPAAVGPPPAAAPVASAPVLAPQSPGVVAQPAGASGPGTVTSPLAGKVVSVQVQVGQDVKEGQAVVTIEAMKMNTYVNAPKTGKVAQVLVNAGDGVDEGQPLLTIE
jgi:glutaconyl-CoA/methylmalonyl-CoA decarboxylase subunit gamma